MRRTTATTDYLKECMGTALLELMGYTLADVKAEKLSDLPVRLKAYGEAKAAAAAAARAAKAPMIYFQLSPAAKSIQQPMMP